MSSVWLVYRIDFDNMENRDPIVRRLLGWARTRGQAEDFTVTQKQNVYEGWDRESYPKYEVVEVKEL